VVFLLPLMTYGLWLVLRPESAVATGEKP